MAIPQLKLLINLAKSDGKVVEKEIKFITNIGLANGIPVADITSLFDESHDLIIPANMDENERFGYILSLVQLMKIDEKLYKEEIHYCAKVASKMGYEEAVIFDLMLHARAVMGTNEVEALRNLASKYLKAH